MMKTVESKITGVAQEMNLEHYMNINQFSVFLSMKIIAKIMKFQKQVHL